MLRSMTGFGRAEGSVNEKKVTVELRSLNSKQLDLLVKMPASYREKEAELRQWASEHVVRGKAELYVSVEAARSGRRTTFNTELVRSLHEELRGIAAEVAPGGSTDLLGHVLRMPEVMNAGQEDLDPAEWEGVMKLVTEAGQAFHRFRLSEGKKLEGELQARTAGITSLLSVVEALDGGRVERTRERLQARLQELKAEVDQDRFEQELIFYLEKMDITEEKVRLRAHCAYFLETMTNEEQQGRKLGFIAQEMGREINTIGSKCNDATMQRSVVLMKDELEKIKEQVQNVL